MSKRWKSYLGGHMVLTQPTGLRMRQLEIDAAKAQRRARDAQAEYDRRYQIHSENIARLKRIDRADQKHRLTRRDESARRNERKLLKST